MAETVCGLDAALAVIGGKWKPLILFHLYRGSRRFGELRRLIGAVSEKVLIQQLRDLEAAGVVLRKDHQEVPPRVDYSITDFGRSLAECLEPLCAWGNANRAQVEARIGTPQDGAASSARAA